MAAKEEAGVAEWREKPRRVAGGDSNFDTLASCSPSSLLGRPLALRKLRHDVSYELMTSSSLSARDHV